MLQQIIRACGQIIRAEMIANSQQRGRHLRQTSWRFFFIERASTSNIYSCCAINQNNPHILKRVTYDQPCLLPWTCAKFFLWAPPVPLGNFYPLAHPPPRNFHWPSVGGGGGVWIFSGITQFHPVDTASCSKFRKLKCLWHVSFTDLVLWPCSCTVFRLQYTQSALVAFL